MAKRVRMVMAAAICAAAATGSAVPAWAYDPGDALGWGLGIGYAEASNGTKGAATVAVSFSVAGLRNGRAVSETVTFAGTTRLSGQAAAKAASTGPRAGGIAETGTMSRGPAAALASASGAGTASLSNTGFSTAATAASAAAVRGSSVATAAAPSRAAPSGNTGRGNGGFGASGQNSGHAGGAQGRSGGRG